MNLPIKKCPFWTAFIFYCLKSPRIQYQEIENKMLYFFTGMSIQILQYIVAQALREECRHASLSN